MTQTIKVPIRVTTVEEVMTEITLPAYFSSKNGFYHYKVLDDRLTICVTEMEFTRRYGIEITGTYSAFIDTKPCSDASFYEAYARVSDHMARQSGIELHELKQEEAWMENLEDRRELMEEKANNQHY